MKKLCVLFLIFSSSCLFAQIKVNYDKYKILAGSENFYAEVYKKENKYQLEVYNNLHRYKMWDSEYFYISDYPGILSDRGTAFVSINREYNTEEPLVCIYYKGEAVYKLYAKDLGINEKDLYKNKSGVFWIKGKSYNFVSKKKKLCLKISAVGRKKFYIDTATGEFLELK